MEEGFNKEEVLERLKNDDDYYGDFGKQFRSNSDISTLLTNPLALGNDIKKSPALLIGGYFHTAILEPEKLNKYKIIKSTTRNTKAYKEISGGEMCLLEHEVDKITLMIEKLMSNDVCKDLVNGIDVDYEVPGITKLDGLWWKGKADILNHTEKLIVDLKTTADITKFRSSAFRYNYDSQAYIYNKLFGYEMLYIVVDKSNHQIGIFDCSPEFYESGEDKVARATDAYNLFYNSEDFDPQQYFINKTL